MSSGLASPQSMVEQQQASLRPSLSSSSYSSYGGDWMPGPSRNEVFTDSFRQQMLAQHPPGQLPHASNRMSNNSPAPTPSATYNASTPTLTSSIPSATRATSPPLLPSQPRRLSLVQTTGSFFHGGTGSVTEIPTSVGREVSNESDAYANMPDLEPLLSTNSHETATPSFALRTLVSEAMRHPTTSLSAPSAGLASFSMIVTNGSEGRGRSLVDSGLGRFRSSPSPINHARNADVSNAIIASHRQRAARAAREADEAAGAAYFVHDVESGTSQSRRRRSTRLSRQSNSNLSTSSSSAITVVESSSTVVVSQFPSPSMEVPEASVSAAGSSVSRMSIAHSSSAISSRKRRAASNGRSAAGVRHLEGNASHEQDDGSPPPIAFKKHRRSPQANLKKPPPGGAKHDINEVSESKELPCRESCAICMCEPSREEISTIDGCSHYFCFGCIGKWADRENTCPLCKGRFSKITRVHAQRRKSKNGPSIHNIKRVKQRDQRSDIVTGAALEGLLASYVANNGLPASLRGRLGIMATRMGPGIIPSLQQHSSGAATRRNANAHLGSSFSPDSPFSLDNVFGDSSSDDDDGPGAYFPSFMNLFSRRNFQDHPSTRNSSAGSGHSQHPPHFPFSVSASSSSTAAAVASGLLSLTSGTSYQGTSGNGGTPSSGPSYHYNLRSYATNGNDPSAGHASNNPLEIFDDDSDSDDSVEVVQVVATTTSAL